jgi:hypothetical protein
MPPRKLLLRVKKEQLKVWTNKDQQGHVVCRRGQFSQKDGIISIIVCLTCPTFANASF